MLDPPTVAGSPASSKRPEPTIDELVIADDPQSWSALGFTVTEGCCRLGGVRLRFAGRGAGKGILRWSLRAITSTDLDGLPTSHSDSAIPTSGPSHRNGVSKIDHIVAMTPRLNRTVSLLQAAGLDLRRIREEPTPAGAPRQAFFRLGPEILEVVQKPDTALEQNPDRDHPAHFWGLALLVEDIEHTVAQIGPEAGPVRPAVQPGRQIATLRRSAGLAIPVALMSSPSRAQAL